MVIAGMVNAAGGNRFFCANTAIFVILTRESRFPESR